MKCKHLLSMLWGSHHEIRSRSFITVADPHGHGFKYSLSKHSWEDWRTCQRHDCGGFVVSI